MTLACVCLCLCLWSGVIQFWNVDGQGLILKVACSMGKWIRLADLRSLWDRIKHQFMEWKRYWSSSFFIKIHIGWLCISYYQISCSILCTWINDNYQNRIARWLWDWFNIATQLQLVFKSNDWPHCHQKNIWTRKHSSRMHAAHMPTVGDSVATTRCHYHGW